MAPERFFGASRCRQRPRTWTVLEIPLLCRRHALLSGRHRWLQARGEGEVLPISCAVPLPLGGTRVGTFNLEIQIIAARPPETARGEASIQHSRPNHSCPVQDTLDTIEDDVSASSLMEPSVPAALSNRAKERAIISEDSGTAADAHSHSAALDASLDMALEATFPASDPVAISSPS
jgi:hypothetical protein